MTRNKRNKYGNLVTEEFKRPDHPDFSDSSELKKKEFSGIRLNSLTHEWEIWVVGELKAHGPQIDQVGFMEAYQEVFAIENIAFITQAYDGLVH